ncbi:nacht wd40 domain-containing protein [Moniliophthora roreri]|nr:nacht wd40 domain-containing protein [Moniliophthora roreri]
MTLSSRLTGRYADIRYTSFAFPDPALRGIAQCRNLKILITNVRLETHGVTNGCYEDSLGGGLRVGNAPRTC